MVYVLCGGKMTSLELVGRLRGSAFLQYDHLGQQQRFNQAQIWVTLYSWDV